jgi:hypothetical protein
LVSKLIPPAWPLPLLSSFPKCCSKHFPWLPRPRGSDLSEPSLVTFSVTISLALSHSIHLDYLSVFLAFSHGIVLCIYLLTLCPPSKNHETRNLVFCLLISKLLRKDLCTYHYLEKDQVLKFKVWF